MSCNFAISFLLLASLLNVLIVTYFKVIKVYYCYNNDYKHSFVVVLDITCNSSCGLGCCCHNRCIFGHAQFHYKTVLPFESPGPEFGTCPYSYLLFTSTPSVFVYSVYVDAVGGNLRKQGYLLNIFLLHILRIWITDVNKPECVINMYKCSTFPKNPILNT